MNMVLNRSLRNENACSQSVESADFNPNDASCYGVELPTCHSRNARTCDGEPMKNPEINQILAFSFF